MKQKNAIWLLLFALNSCHTGDHTQGVHEPYLGYIPARISVLPCQPWPESLRLKTLPLTSAPTEEVAKLCEHFNHFIIEGFQDQPYLKGYTPAVVQKLLDRKGHQDHLQNIKSIWRYQPQASKLTDNFLTLYQNDISQRKQWQLWLQTLSQNTRQSDATLLPLVTHLDERQQEDRGLMSFRKEAGLALWLIDNNTAQLIWSGSREAAVVRYSEIDNKAPEKPVWDDLKPRLFVRSLWKDFPGRSIH